MKLTFTVPEGPDRKAYHILRRELKASAALVRRLKTAGALFVNGEPAFTDRMLKPGDILSADLNACEPPCDLVSQTGPVSVLYEEEGFLIVNKPAGQLVHPTHSRYTDTLSNYAAGYLGSRSEAPVVHAVNRLDRDTGGLVLFAKNSHMMALLSDALAAPSTEKQYLALVCGIMPDEAGTIDAPIRRVNENDMRREVNPEGQRAVTHYQVIASDGTISLLKLKLETGRTHQIRVHCAHLGCPLLGDRLYGTEPSLAHSAALGVSSQLLHAFSLTFPHPYREETISVNAPVQREEFKKILDYFQFNY